MAEVFTGTVSGQGLIAASARLVIDGTRHAMRVGDQLTLTRPEGELVIELAHAEANDLPSRDGAWAQVQADPRAPIFEEHAPGDHVHVELGGWAIVGGDALGVRGEVIGDKDGVPTRIRAHRLAIGDKAIASLGRERPERAPAAPAPPTRVVRVPAMPHGPLCLGVGALLVVAALGQASGLALASNTYAATAAYELAIGAALIVAGGLWLAARHAFERVQIGKPPAALYPTWSLGGGLGIVGGILGAFAVLGWISSTSMGAVALAWGAAATGLAFLGWIWLRQSDHLRLGALIVRARPIGPDDAAFGRLEGIVEDGDLSRDVEYVTRRRKRDHVTTNKRGNQTWRERTVDELETRPGQHAAKLLRVKVGAHVVEVETEGAAWAAPIAYQPTTGRAVYTRQAVGRGDAIAIVGRIKHDGDRRVVRATGPESLLIFGAPRDAGATARRVVWMWRLRLSGALFALAGAGVAGWRIWSVIHRG